MGYRHYVGFIPKAELSRILKEVEELKAKIGESNPDEPGEVYCDYDVTRFMRNNTTCLLELGKLYWTQQQGIYDLLYKNKTEDFSDDDTEFFFINDDKFFYNLSIESQRIWIDCIRDYQEKLNKIINSKEPIEIKLDTELLGGIYEILSREIKNFDSIINYIEEVSKRNGKLRDLPPFNKNQYNYVAVEYFLKHKHFDYENNQLCIFAY